MAIPEAEWIWVNGELVPWNEAKVHVLAHALHFGTSAFEGARAYATPQGPAVFRMGDHVDRLLYSCKVLRLDLPFGQEEVERAILKTIRANGHKACYIRPLVFSGYGDLGLFPKDNPVEVIIATWEWGSYYGEESLSRGADVVVSSWRRLAPATMPVMAKLGGHYINSQLAAREAHAQGFTEAIMLDANGYVSEGPGSNLFLVYNGVLCTPPRGLSLMPGITRDSVITLAGELGYPVQEELVAREMLYRADEIFMTGTAAEITPVRAVDGLPVGIGARGPVTKALQDAFFAIVRGEVADRHGWLTVVRAPVPVGG